MIEPWWPLVVLALIQAGDAVLCRRPVPFIRDCLVAVGFPQRYWRLLTPVKAAAAVGLVVGIRFPPLAVLTCAALVCYFVVAIGAHVLARDFGRNLFLNATGMLALCTASLVFVLQAG